MMTMSRSTPGPVLAYPVPAAAAAAQPPFRTNLDRLLASHGFVLERRTRPATGQAVFRLVDEVTGRAPVNIPPALASELAAWAADEILPARVRA
jgi:hypothetical protein